MINARRGILTNLLFDCTLFKSILANCSQVFQLLGRERNDICATKNTVRPITEWAHVTCLSATDWVTLHLLFSYLTKNVIACSTHTDNLLLLFNLIVFRIIYSLNNRAHDPHSLRPTDTDGTDSTYFMKKVHRPLEFCSLSVIHYTICTVDFSYR